MSRRYNIQLHAHYVAQNFQFEIYFWASRGHEMPWEWMRNEVPVHVPDHLRARPLDLDMIADLAWLYVNRQYARTAIKSDRQKRHDR